MPEITKYDPGQFCWVELGTSDAEAATSFYSEVFDWGHDIHPMDEGEGEYTILQKNKKDIGGLYKLFPDMLKMGVPPNWLSYVSVTSADDACEKAKSLGGTVFMPPMDVKDQGRMAVLSDPTGGSFAVWEPRSHCGSLLRGEPDSPCWTELLTKDTKKAGAFYSQLFGWETKTDQMGPIEYTMFVQGGEMVGGMMAPTPEMGEVPTYWCLYFAVDDCEGFVERAAGKGANVLAPPMDVPNFGRMAMLMDPQGACFAVIKLTKG